MSIHEPTRTNSRHHHNNHHKRKPDQPYLHPQDAFYAQSPPPPSKTSLRDIAITSTSSHVNVTDARTRREKRRGRSSSRRRRNAAAQAPTAWRKLLWVKQSYPDNYTDEETFLDHLQRNPRLRPYEFWPLVADSTIIVQHVCSVVIFVCCFSGIYLKRVSPQTVVTWATMGTVAGWVLRDWWQSRELLEVEREKESEGNGTGDGSQEDRDVSNASSPEIADFGMPFTEQRVPLATATAAAPETAYATSSPRPEHSRDPSTTSQFSNDSIELPPWLQNTTSNNPSYFSPRTQARLTTAKSAILIYCSLLGLSPILKSLTESTSADSIWALSSWLMILNVFTFDYGAGPEAKFPASLSTNAAVMASTVLASRLEDTTEVFSLSLFSIEVFGLFPVFRRHLRHHSWTGHLLLTIFLIGLASSALSMTISGGGWVMGVVGVVLGGVGCGVCMGLTSWWLIGLQRFKNEIRGPWDPARPVLMR